MFRKSALAILIFIPLFAKASDPNLNSFKNAGECSELSGDKNCIYCPIKKRFISLSTNSKDQTPKDEDYEYINSNGKSEEGTR